MNSVWHYLAGGVLSAALLSAAGCGQTALPAASSWQEPASYQYTVDSSCGERLLIGRLQLTVADGKVTQATGVDESGKNVVALAKLTSLPTLKDLLDEYETARQAGAHVAKAEYDAADGHPTWIEIDTSRTTMDDEACYLIYAYQPFTEISLSFSDSPVTR